MQHRYSELFCGYWEKIGAGRETGPNWADVNLSDLKRFGLFPHVFMLQTTRSRSGKSLRPVYKMAGEALCSYFDMELSGMAYLSLWNQSKHDKLQNIFEKVLIAGKPVCVSSTGLMKKNASVEMETLLTPIRFHEDFPSHLFGITTIIDDRSAAGKISCQSFRAASYAHEFPILSQEQPSLPFKTRLNLAADNRELARTEPRGHLTLVPR